MFLPVHQTSNGIALTPSKITGSGLKIMKYKKSVPSVRSGMGAALLLSNKAGSGVAQLTDKLKTLSLRTPKKTNIKFII